MEIVNQPTVSPPHGQSVREEDNGLNYILTHWKYFLPGLVISLITPYVLFYQGEKHLETGLSGGMKEIKGDMKDMETSLRGDMKEIIDLQKKAQKERQLDKLRQELNNEKNKSWFWH